MTIRRGIFILLLTLLFSRAGAQVTMRDVIRQMPDSLVPYLKANARLDFIDFIDSGMKAQVSNDLGGKSQLTQLTDDYASFTLSAVSQLQMRLLSVDEPVDSARHIICMVRTYGGDLRESTKRTNGSDLRESTIRFYTLQWRPLPSAPRIALPPYAHQIQLSAQTPELTVLRDTSMDRPANEEQKEIESVLSKFKWDGKVFKIY